MYVFIFLLSIWVLFKTISYGIFEIKENKNTLGGIVVIILAIITAILPNVTHYIFGHG